MEPKSEALPLEFIGYAAFDYFEDAYFYNENACYIADSQASLKELIENSNAMLGEYRIDSISFDDLLRDFGVSCGEFALKGEALKRFEAIGKKSKLKYSKEVYDDWKSGLYVVKIEYKYKAGQRMN